MPFADPPAMPFGAGAPRGRPGRAALRADSHLGLVSAHGADNDERVARFARRGLAEGARVALVGPPGQPGRALRHLAASGVPPAPALASGQLVVAAVRALYGAHHRDVLGLVAALGGASDAARAAGFSGLRFAIDMAAMAGGLGSFELLLTFEQLAAEAQARCGVSALCLHDEQDFSPTEARRLVAMHHDGERAEAPMASFAASLEPFGLCLGGEVDLANRATMLRALSARLDAQQVVTLDLTALSFIDVGSLAAIFALAHTLPVGHLVLANVPDHVSRILGATGLADERVRCA